MGQVLSTMSSILFGPNSNSNQLVAATTTFGAPGQNQSRTVINDSASPLIIDNQPNAVMTSPTESQKKEDKLQLETSQSAQLTVAQTHSRANVSANDLQTIALQYLLKLASDCFKANGPEVYTEKQKKQTPPHKIRSLPSCRNLTLTTNELTEPNSKASPGPQSSVASRVKQQVVAHLANRGDFFVGSDGVVKIKGDEVPFGYGFHLHAVDETEEV